MALILIVDDSPTEVFVMQKALEKHGFKTAAAENGDKIGPPLETVKAFGDDFRLVGIGVSVLLMGVFRRNHYRLIACASDARPARR